MSKSEVLNILAKLALDKIEKFENERQNSVNSMSESNLPHYLKGQDRLIQSWRKLLVDLKKYQGRSSSCVEDGALVNIAGYPSAEWVFIYKFRSSMNIEGATVEIDDGQLGRLNGSIHGARAGDKITLKGDERSISDITVQILKVL